MKLPYRWTHPPPYMLVIYRLCQEWIKVRTYESGLTFADLQDHKLVLNCSAHWPSEPYAGFCWFFLVCCRKCIKLIFVIRSLFCEMFSVSLSELTNTDVCFTRQFSLAWHSVINIRTRTCCIVVHPICLACSQALFVYRDRM